MEISSVACPIVTNADRRWPYHQHYLGEEDQEQRRNGQGRNYWSGAESLESYCGSFIRDMMHGEGIYRWKYKGPEETFMTYEGKFYGNRMHGYGVMSFPDGTVFNGTYYNNVRWGPGIMSHTSLQEDVGLWRGNQLVRLAWRPQTYSVVLDLNFGPSGRTYVESHRALLATRVKMVGEVNSAIELLKQSQAKPMTASDKWAKIYPKHCTDLASQLCQVTVFDHEYYKDNIVYLEEIESLPVPESKEDIKLNSEEEYPFAEIYFAWNNSPMMIDMMKHCFKHETQRYTSGLNLTNILTGPRNQYKSAAKHEIDARTLIMASYLGYIIKVAQLVNECNVHPDVADCLGNTALMYATCGDRPDLVHFLVEAGANVHSFNDSCCTPLGVALMKFACESKGIVAQGMAQALVPVLPNAPTSLEEKPSDWHIQRDLSTQNAAGDQLTRTPSKTNKTNVLKKTKSLLFDESGKKKTAAVGTTTSKEQENVNDDDIDDSSSEEQRLYRYVNSEFQIKVNDLFSIPSGATPPVPYLFEVSDMVPEVNASYVTEEEPKKHNADKAPKKNASKVIKDTLKPSEDMMWKGSDRGSVISADFRAKLEKLNQNMPTILQLLADGADPCLVRCPQSALWIATASGSPELVRHLCNHGADINEVNPESLNYTILDVAVSKPLSYENLELIRTILECGARTDHRLKCENLVISGPSLPEVPGPTLLHAVLAKNTNDNGVEEEVRCQLLELLLEYNCSAVVQYKGSSALDLAMIKHLDLLEIFMKCSKTDLNAVINDKNQSVLVKMFSLQFCKTIPVDERLQTLTNLLLYGADPLLECQDGDNKYQNIFVYAKLNLVETETNTPKPTGTAPPKGAKPDPKGKNVNEKIKKEEKTKSTVKMGSDYVGDYKQALDLVTECARILHIRWIEAKLLKELIEIVEKYQHRQWNMIVPEQKNKKACGLWLSCDRSLEIWDILKKTRKKRINDRRILKHVLCIVLFNFNRSRTTFKQPITADEKSSIENEVCYILREHKIQDIMETERVDLARLYVTPELAVGSEIKFQVCFECALPFETQNIRCTLCKQVSFCSFDCIKANVKQATGHPCSEYLMNKFFPGTSTNDTSLPSDF